MKKYFEANNLLFCDWHKGLPLAECEIQNRGKRKQKIICPDKFEPSFKINACSTTKTLINRTVPNKNYWVFFFHK